MNYAAARSIKGGRMSQKQINAGDLGIDLSSLQEKEVFKWFLACLLFGKPIAGGGQEGLPGASRAQHYYGVAYRFRALAVE